MDSYFIQAINIGLRSISSLQKNEIFVHIQAKLDQENLLRMLRRVKWHCPPDTRLEIQTLEVWGRARYVSVTEAPHNTEFYESMGKKRRDRETNPEF